MLWISVCALAIVAPGYALFGLGESQHGFGPYPKLDPNGEWRCLVQCDERTPSLRLALTQYFFQGKFDYEQMQRFGKADSITIKDVTHCDRIGFAYLWSDGTLTKETYQYRAQDKYHLVREVNGRAAHDLIVNVRSVQPASGLLDPTINTNLGLSTWEPELQKMHPLLTKRTAHAETGLDEVFPRNVLELDLDSSIRRYFFTPEDAPIQSIVRCNFGGMYEICWVLSHSAQDGVAFSLLVPFSELRLLPAINERTLAMLRQWRAAATSG